MNQQERNAHMRDRIVEALARYEHHHGIADDLLRQATCDELHECQEDCKPPALKTKTTNPKEIDMNATEARIYSQRYDIDQQVEAMRNRIIEERRHEIGRMAAHQEAIEVTANWYRAQYDRIENEAASPAHWGAIDWAKQNVGLD